MNREQFERASAIIAEDCTGTGAMHNSDGTECALGGLFRSLHPDWGHDDLYEASAHDASYHEVADAFGFSYDQAWNIANINDQYEYIDERRAAVQRELERIFNNSQGDDDES